MSTSPVDSKTAFDSKQDAAPGNERVIAAHELGTSGDDYQREDDIANDAVFGAISSDGPNYRAVGWVGTAVLMIKTQVGLGVLGIPYVLTTLGIVPGVICLLVIGVITTWSDYVVGQFKLRHPTVYAVDDVGELLFGRVGREVFAFAYCMFMLAVVGSGLLGISIALNAVSSHATCTAAFVAIAAILGFCLASIPTLGKVTILGWIGVISILSALFTLTIAVGVQDRPAAAPAGDWLAIKTVHVTNAPTFEAGISAISTLVFAYAGTPAFFGIVAEMRDQRMYTRSMLLCQGIVTVTYIVIGVVVYYFCGQFVASPALGSAGVLMKKVCYGLALPGLAVTVCLYTHLPAKYILVRILRDSRHLSSNTWQHWTAWLSCTLGCTLFSYVLASSVPVFGGLVGLVGALFGTLLSMQIMGAMWLFDNWGRRHTDKSTLYRLLVGWNVFIIIVGSFIMVAGTYGSIKDIMAGYAATGGSRPFSCADNSNST